MCSLTGEWLLAFASMKLVMGTGSSTEDLLAIALAASRLLQSPVVCMDYVAAES